MHQFYKYGKFLDNNPRTNNDLNDYEIDYAQQIAVFNVYNQKNEFVGTFKVDLEDIEKVKYHKWRFCKSFNHKRKDVYYVITGLPAKGTQRSVAHEILGIDSKTTDKVIDHINGDTTDNRKANLRVISQQENRLSNAVAANNTSGWSGVYWDSFRNRWSTEIKKNSKRIHLRRRKTLKEAVYSRFIAEQELFQEFAREDRMEDMKNFTNDLPKETKELIKNQTLAKIHEVFDD